MSGLCILVDPSFNKKISWRIYTAYPQLPRWQKQGHQGKVSFSHVYVNSRLKIINLKYPLKWNLCLYSNICRNLYFSWILKYSFWKTSSYKNLSICLFPSLAEESRFTVLHAILEEFSTNWSHAMCLWIVIKSSLFYPKNICLSLLPA